jgi:hypothetical protein
MFVSIVSKGSTKTVLQVLALDIFSACLKFNVNIDMVWIPRSENDRAIFQYTGYQKYRRYKQAINAMPINCKGINASGIHNPKSGIKYMKQCNAVGTLIVPCWQSASFWPMLCPGGDGFIDQVKSYIS